MGARAFGLLFSGSWDGTVGAWDPRNPTPHVASLPMPAKVFTMSMTDTRLVVGTAERHVLIYDVRKLSEPEQRRQSKLMHQTRCIRTFPTFNGYALTSIEGRVAIEYFEKSLLVAGVRVQMSPGREHGLPRERVSRSTRRTAPSPRAAATAS